MKRKKRKRQKSELLKQKKQNDRKERKIMTPNFLNPEQLEEKIGYKFSDISILEEALTHSSYSNELSQKHIECRCNERLEFLGDSVLSIIVSEYLFEQYSAEAEGKLTNRRRELVCEKALAHYSDKLSLGDYLRLGRGEDKNGGRRNKSILADAFEALLAAIYLDAGVDGKTEVSKFLLPYIKNEMSASAISGESIDYKTLLQQFTQQTDGELPEYVEISESGPAHMKKFEIEVRLNNNIIGRGKGKTKKEAEQNAAEEACRLFEISC